MLCTDDPFLQDATRIYEPIHPPGTLQETLDAGTLSFRRPIAVDSFVDHLY